MISKSTAKQQDCRHEALKTEAAELTAIFAAIHKSSKS
jgi:hypothetical protein